MQGEYLAQLGNCAACHTARGGEPFAGGKAIHTPFGAVYASNITPDPVHGIGSWSAEAFYRAMKHGVNAQGRLLTPAFPYTNYTSISRADSDALYAYFQQGVKPVAQASREHELGFPFNTQLALAVWRVLFFSPEPDTINSIALRADSMPANDPKGFKNEVERGRYIVNGLGHCSACHAQRNALGAVSSDGLLSGALMPMQDWYAPSLHAREEAGVQHWPREQIVAFLKNGVTQNASALGPMAEVVAKSTQYWRDEDLQATAAYLQSLPVYPAPSKKAAKVSPQTLSQGAALYAQHCATCHGENGQGIQETDGLAQQGILPSVTKIPALAGNRAVSLSSSANLVRIILAGGYAPSTAGNPRPYGMPPFVHVLTDDDIAAVTTYIRASWGNQANAVSASEVVAQRRGVLQ
ncbi:cytochrome c [Variovorax sp. PCZ-1]|uniref:c-type cytochrome n=1 Tax=Variovorax sp. PCZ-1 TaxID=2835533 RepID=UPI0020C167DB|nr:cytochrome c [Variovorax sp. PCZ-1]